MSYAGEIVLATNYIGQCTLPEGARSARAIDRGLRRSCRTLGDLIRDPDFAAFLERGPLARRTPDEIPNHVPVKWESGEGLHQLDIMREDAGHLHAFLVAEFKLLTLAGLDTQLCNQTVAAIDEVIREGSYNETFDLAGALLDLHGQICRAQRDHRRDHRRQIASSTGEFLAGTSVAVLNGSLLAVAAGLAGGLQAASMIVGGAVASRGYSRFRELIR